MAGDHIGKYAVLGEAGRGGMGIVYHAHDESLDRDVAIKVIPDSLAGDAKRMARFQREGKLLASLNHPNIAAIYEVDQEDSRSFVVLEYVPGDTLAEMIGRGGVPWKRMLPIAIQIADAIEYAHQEGVIHRDLKPQNVKFDSKGNVKVLDFGLAKAVEDEEAETPQEPGGPRTPSPDSATVLDLPSGSQALSSTRPGMMMGTIGYLSPEQACGHEVDKQSDIFSFGCILFEMLTGAAPFASKSAVDAIGRTLHKEPAWEQLPADTPGRLKALLRRCLAKEKKDRLRDIGDARLELLELRDHQEEFADVAQAPAGNRALLAIALLAAIAAIAFGGLYLFDQSALQDPGATSIEPVSHRAIAIPENLKTTAFASTPNDERLFVVCFEEVNADRKGGPPVLEWRLFTRDRDSADLNEAHHFTALAGYDLAPDGKSFALNVNGRISRARIDSTADPIELARVPNARNAAGGFQLFPAKRGIIWFDDETIIVEAADDQGQQQLVLLNAKTGDIKKVVPIKLESKALRFDGLIGRFDDDHVLMYVSLYNDEGFSINIATVSLTTGELKVLVERAGFAQAIGDQLFFSRGDSLYVARFNPETHELLDAGHPVMQGLNAQYGTHSNFNITDEGTLVFMPGGVIADKRRMMVNAGNGLEPTGLPDAPFDNQVTVSADGSQICTTVLREDGMWEIWGGTLDPPRMRKIMARNDADYCFPRLSYDGTTLGFAQIETTPEGVELAYLVAPMNGTQPSRIVRRFVREDDIQMSCFSIDNSRILVDRPDVDQGSGYREIVELDLETGEYTDMISRPGGAHQGMWSPDGKLISFISMETGVPELRILEPNSGEIIPVADTFIIDYRWLERPDGRLSLVYWDRDYEAWESAVTIGPNDEVTVDPTMDYPFVVSASARFYTIDNRGRVFSIESDPDEERPNHITVIENWLPSVLAEEN
ncbi:MAG: protein kinase [Phycisphaerales bacterium]|nr:protein kinase [Phycisphaerales bacterium]